MLTQGQVEQLVREYIANEILREAQSSTGIMATRVLGEVLANKAGMPELVVSISLDIAREIAAARLGRARG